MDALQLDSALAARGQQLAIHPYDQLTRLRSPLRVGRRLMLTQLPGIRGAKKSPRQYEATGHAFRDLPVAKVPALGTGVGRAFPLPSTMSAWEVVDEALQVAAGRRSVFGREVIPTGADRWRKDPFSGRRWPKRLASFIDLEVVRRDADVLSVLELNHLHHVTKLAQAFLLTDEPVFAEAFLEETADWASANPVGMGVNWTSGLDVGLRAANLAWALMLFRRHESWSAYCETPLLRLLIEHRDFMWGHLEDWGELSNNHYLSNVAALIVTSVGLHWAVDCEAQISYLASLLARCMTQQVDADGMHFENSLAYHCFVTEAFAYATLALRSLGRDMPADFLEHLARMFDVLENVANPDGTFPFIGDSSDGRFIVTESYFERRATDARPTLSLRGQVDGRSADAASRLESTSSVGHRASGIYVLRSERLTVTATCMPTGIHGRGGHRHNDLLAFELALDGMPAIVDPGTYCYGSNPKARLYFRSTKAHNTMTANDAEQNGITPAFILREDRARLSVHGWRPSASSDELDVTSHALGCPPSDVEHRRRFSLDKRSHLLSIGDCIEGSGRRTLEWFFHLAPGARLSVQGPGRLECAIGASRFELTFRGEQAAGELEVEVIDDWVSRAYLEATPATTIRLVVESASLPFRLSTEIRPL